MLSTLGQGIVRPLYNPGLGPPLLLSNKWILASIFWAKSMARPNDVGSRTLNYAAISCRRPLMNLPTTRSSKMFSKGVVISMNHQQYSCIMPSCSSTNHYSWREPTYVVCRVTRSSSLPIKPLSISCFPIGTIIGHLLQS